MTATPARPKAHSKRTYIQEGRTIIICTCGTYCGAGEDGERAWEDHTKTTARPWSARLAPEKP